MKRVIILERVVYMIIRKSTKKYNKLLDITHIAFDFNNSQNKEINDRFIDVSLNDFFDEEDYEGLSGSISRSIKKAISRGGELLRICEKH